MLEMNTIAQHGKITAAQDAIHSGMVTSDTDPEERQAIQDAFECA
jgi:hypothetical protein